MAFLSLPTLSEDSLSCLTKLRSRKPKTSTPPSSASGASARLLGLASLVGSGACSAACCLSLRPSPPIMSKSAEGGLRGPSFAASPSIGRKLGAARTFSMAIEQKSGRLLLERRHSHLSFHLTLWLKLTFVHVQLANDAVCASIDGNILCHQCIYLHKILRWRVVSR